MDHYVWFIEAFQCGERHYWSVERDHESPNEDCATLVMCEPEDEIVGCVLRCLNEVEYRLWLLNSPDVQLVEEIDRLFYNRSY